MQVNAHYTINRLSEETGIDRRTLKKILSGVDPVDLKGKSRLYTIRQLVEALRGAGGMGAGYEAARVRLTEAQADLTELNVREKDGELLPASEVEQMIIRKVVAARAGLLSLPSRIAPVVMAATSIKEVEDFARDFIYEVLNELADGVAEDQIEMERGMETSSTFDDKRVGAEV